MNYQRTFESKPTPAYLEAVGKLNAIEDKSRVYADSSSEGWFIRYQEKNGVTQSSMGICRAISKLSNKPFKQSDSLYFSLPGADHTSVWRKGKTIYSVVTQPYGIGGKHLDELINFCRGNNLHLSIDAWGSWHFPGQTLLIELTADCTKTPLR